MRQSEERYIKHEDSKKAYRDIKNSIDTARRERVEEGINITNATIAKRMISDGVDIEFVMKYTGMTKEQIEKSINK